MMAADTKALYARVEATYKTPSKAIGIALTTIELTGTWSRGEILRRNLEHGRASSLANDQIKRDTAWMQALPAMKKHNVATVKRTVPATRL
jgi:hypothetical protein